MKKRHSCLPDLVPFLLVSLTVLGTAFVFTACGPKEDGSWMRCHRAHTLVLTVGSVLAVLLLAASFLGRKGWPGVLLYILGSVGSVFLFLIPGVLCPLCMMHTMDCYRLMQPFVRVMSAAVMLSSAYRAFRARSTHRAHPAE